jgi:hypothetical protein
MPPMLAGMAAFVQKDRTAGNFVTYGGVGKLNDLVESLTSLMPKGEKTES